ELVEAFPTLGSIREKMRLQGVGEMIFKSGIKVGKPNPESITKLSSLTTEGFNPSSIVTLDNNSYGLQLNPYSQVDNKVAIFTQLMYFLNVLGNNRDKANT